MSNMLENDNLPVRWPALDGEMQKCCKSPRDVEAFVAGAIAAMSSVSPSLNDVLNATRYEAIQRFSGMLEGFDERYWVENFWRTLSPHYRYYVAGRLAGLSYEEIAASVDIPLSKRETMRDRLGDKWKAHGYGRNKAWYTSIRACGYRLPTKRNWRTWSPSE